MTTHAKEDRKIITINDRMQTAYTCELTEPASKTFHPDFQCHRLPFTRILGEMSIFLDEPRTSSVRISKDALTLVFTGDNFLAAIINTPDLAKRILKSLSNKLKSANQQLILNSACETRAKQVDKSVIEPTAEK